LLVRTGRQRLAKFNHHAGPPHSKTLIILYIDVLGVLGGSKLP